jgi:tetratricopeptide (TPR) repeat protein
LNRAGRQADALDSYRSHVRFLDETYGLAPGPELRALNTAILATEPPTAAPPLLPMPQQGAAVIPAQLPLDLAGFVGRRAELSALDLAATAAIARQTVGLVVLSGMGGVGKTALAVRWAHQVRDRFPDGQLYLNLRGFHPGAAALTPGEALPGFLMALGVRAEQIPPTLDAQAGLYRTRLADRRVLVLLDNARDAAQVRPLLPGAPGCLALITSRHTLTGLVAAEAAHPVPLDLLTLDESGQLLAHRLGAARTAAEPDAVDAIVERCARLPLALAIAAARAAARPRVPLAELAAELAELTGNVRRLDAFSTGDAGTDVRTVFSWSYLLLRPAAARLFRLLGLPSGADLSADAVASLAGSSRPDVAPLLAELLAAHLLAEPAPGRYAMHDLLRAYAAERAADEEPEPARHAALTRLFDHYLDTARSAIQVLFPAELGHLPSPSGPVRGMAGPAAARSWLDAERVNLTAATGHAAGHGWPRHAAALATTLHHYLDSGYPADTLIVHTHAHRAAHDAGDHSAEATALNHLGIAHRRAGRFQQAGEHHQQALALCRQVADRAGEARALTQIGIAVWRLGRYDEAKQHCQAALDLFREIGDRIGEANQLNMFGIGYRQTGHLDTAIDCHRQAFDLYHDLGNPLGEANSLNGLGAAYHQAGRLHQAIDCQRRALVTVREVGHRPVEIWIRNDLGRALLLLGDHRGARVHHERALALCREAGEHSFEVETVNALGAVLLATGDPGKARVHFTDALNMAERTGDRHEQATAHDGLADTYQATADPECARQHWQQARDIYFELGLPDADRISGKLMRRAS